MSMCLALWFLKLYDGDILVGGFLLIKKNALGIVYSLYTVRFELGLKFALEPRLEIWQAHLYYYVDI